jgi:hypothetical protein
MSKRGFRSQVAPAKRDNPDPKYPTLEGFDGSRRSFLGKLGMAFLGAGTLAAGLSACGGERVVGGKPDQGVGPAGAAPMPDAKVDTTRQFNDIGLSGAAPMPDARVESDLGNIAGGAPMPDAKVDKPKHDMGFGPAGDAPMPDARVDGGN